MNTMKYTDEERKERKRESSTRYNQNHKDDPAYKKRKNENRIKWQNENAEKYKAGMKIANAKRNRTE